MTAMVDRFLSWPLPKDFGPDCGISFDGRKPDQWNPHGKGWPIGTNLFTADQAKAMLEHVVGQTLGAMQAKIDRLMLEHCPEEMTEQQKAEWAKHQVSAGPEASAQLDAAVGTPSAARRTPQCDALLRHPLDSNDVLAWQTLARDLEDDALRLHKDKMDLLDEKLGRTASSVAAPMFLREFNANTLERGTWAQHPVRTLHGCVETLANALKGYLPWPDDKRDGRVRSLEALAADQLARADACLTIIEHAKRTPSAIRYTDKPEMLDDGFGNQWALCRADCALQIVRPGKVQCEADDCPHRTENPSYYP